MQRGLLTFLLLAWLLPVQGWAQDGPTIRPAFQVAPPTVAYEPGQESLIIGLPGVVLWCDDTRGLWGYTLREFRRDGLIELSFADDPYYLRYDTWANGLFASALTLYENGLPNYTYLNQSLGLPVGSYLIGPIQDGSSVLVPNNGLQSIPFATCCYEYSQVLNIANSAGGANPAFYPNGASALDTASLSMQAGQLAPFGGASTSPPNPPALPAQTFNTMVANAAVTPDMVGQPPYSPYPQWLMRNAGIVTVTINGVPDFTILPIGSNFTVQVAISQPACHGHAAEYWVASQNKTNGTVWWLHSDGTWQKHTNPVMAASGTLYDTPPTTIFQGNLGAFAGDWDFWACLDLMPDGVLSNPLICEHAFVRLQ